MAVDMFLKLDDVKGESRDSKHKDEIEVLAWSWGMTQNGTMHIGTGGGAGKVNIQDISITKYIDKSTPNLALYCCNGKHFKEGVLVVRKAGEKPVEYLKITMKEILVSSVSTGGSGGEDRLTENISLNFASFKTEYVPQKPDGSADATITASWHIAENRSA